MSIHASRRARQVPQALRLSPLAACALLVVSGVAPQGALAQTSAEAAPQSVTVTGIRRGIEAAVSVKKNNDNIVEAVSAEDIGKLPDVSVAESIARLPGVSAQRTTGGRAQSVSVRGMAPSFATGLLNGREQASTGDSRSVEFDQFPSELLSGLTLYKTPDAGLVGQGLSGTIDMQTVRPLNFGSRVVQVGLRGQKSGVGLDVTGKGSRFSASYIDQFADRTIGIALGYARLDETGPVTNRFESWGTGDYTLTNGTKVKVPFNGFNAWNDQTKSQRDGAMAVLQWRPNKQFESTLDLFYSEFKQDATKKGFQAPLNDSWNDGKYDKPGVLSNYTLSGSDVTAGTFNNVRGVVRNDSESIRDKLLSVGWNNKMRFGDGWTGVLDLSHSKVSRKNTIIESTSGTVQAAQGAAAMDSIAFTADGKFTPQLNYTDRNVIKITDVQGWGGGLASPQAGYTKLPKLDDEINAIRLGGMKDLGDNAWVNRVHFGVNLTDRSKTRTFTEGRVVVAGGGSLAAADIPGTEVTTIHGIAVPVFNAAALLGSTLAVAPKVHQDIYNKDWTVNEKVTTLYTKGDLTEREVFGVPMRGNVGLQVVHTKQDSRAFNVSLATCKSDVNCPATDATDGTSYYDVLPSANLIFDIARDQVVRVGLARQMARPDMNDMRASNTFGYDATNNILSGSGGNPKLKPFRANALDVSWEKYFGNKGYVAVAGFYKDLSTYILKAPFAVDYTPYLTGSGVPSTVSPLGTFTAPINGSGGSIQGVELSASLPFAMLTPALDGFGVQASYSYTDSSVKLPAGAINGDAISAGTNIPLPGLSKNVAGLTFYYEKSGFSARVATRYRSDFIGEVADILGDRKLTYIRAETITDLQLGYEFQTGMAKGLSVLFQVNNLTNQPYVRYRDTYSQTNEVENTKYGRTYLLGVNYKM